MHVKLKYIKGYIDKTGKVRHYLRRKGLKSVALPGLPGAPEFMAAYNAALQGEGSPSAPGRAGEGTIAAMVTRYYCLAEFDNLDDNSKRVYRIALTPVVDKIGRASVSGFNKDRARKLLEGIASTRGPSIANLTRRVLSKVLNVAEHPNPFTKIPPYKGGTHHTWTDAELEQYEQHWPIGSRERLGYELLLLSAQRGCDVVKVKRNEIINGEIVFKQKKTGVEVTIPVHPTLASAILAWAKGVSIFGDEHGRPVSQRSLANMVMRAARQALLPKRCKPHGLRKAAMRRLAERGASAKELQSVSGHKSLKMVELYTAKADQKKLARAAMKRLESD